MRVLILSLTLMFVFNSAAFGQESPRAADLLFEAGKKYYEQGNYEQALHELEKALLLEPEHAPALMYIQLIEEELALPEPEVEEQIEQIEEIEEIEVPAEQLRQEAMQRALEEAQAKIISEEPEISEEVAPEPIPESTLKEPYPLLGQGKTFIELYNKYYWHNTEFDESGERKRWAYNGRYREVMSELKIEYGLTDNLNLLTSIPYKVALWKDDYNRNTTSGVGDIWMRLKYRLFRQLEFPLTLSLQPGLRFPGGYDENDSPALGQGEIAGELRLLASRSFSSWPGYTKIETGFRTRAEEPTDEIPYFFELGYHPTDWLMLKATIDGVEGLAGTGDLEQDYTKWTTHLIYSPTGGFSTFREEGILNFEFAYGNTFEGKNTANGSEIVFNINYQF